MRIGFIGFGNMGTAFARGLIDYAGVPAMNIAAYAPHQDRLKDKCGRLGVTAETSISQLVNENECIILACKPNQCERVLSQLAPYMYGKVLVSLALGWNNEKILTCLEKSLEEQGKHNGNFQVMSIMPNTPVMVGEGVILVEQGFNIEKEVARQLITYFQAMGVVQEIPLSLMGIGGAISGCGPAFMDIIMEAYADGAVKYGLSREASYRIVSQTMVGAARLQQITNEHPAVLKDKVCSPAGSTIRGVVAMEREGVRNGCISSLDAVMGK